ncbi:MAG: hypothetical protein QOK15_2852 [Nocardioidaceae bacterium]|jgi:hypothetical protein|nr:hypothetical protein [Nocardioidaceae bacterium]
MRLPAVRRALGRTVGTSLAVGALLLSSTGLASADNPATPGDFTGYGFDQCTAPSQSAMDAWWKSSPYWAVGIYISGDSRGCRSQPNLTSSWVSTQLAHGWRLLPITLGPQASCNPRFPRYGTDKRIDPSSAHTYRAARRQGRAEADTTVSVARSLGIVAGSTLWYDLEAYDTGNSACRESALYFTSSWTRRLHKLDYVSGVYSSAASGIKALDDARVDRPGTFKLPDQIWIADWNHNADTSSSYIRSSGWLPGGRMKQYYGGHNETYGGVTINIDQDWLDLGKGSTAGSAPDHCGGVHLSYTSYPTLNPGDVEPQTSALQCLLKEQGYYGGPVNGDYDAATQDAVRTLRDHRRMSDGDAAGPGVWTSLLSFGRGRLVKYGAAGERVRDLQRALNAAVDSGLTVSGVFQSSTVTAVKRYQSRRGLSQTGVVTRHVWKLLKKGRT